MLPRNRPVPKTTETIFETPLNIDSMLDKLSTQKRIISPSFCLFKGRYRTGQQLPSFMENLNNRMSINGLSFEMLKANNFCDPIYLFDEQRHNMQKSSGNIRANKDLFLTTANEI